MPSGGLPHLDGSIGARQEFVQSDTLLLECSLSLATFAGNMLSEECLDMLIHVGRSFVP